MSLKEWQQKQREIKAAKLNDPVVVSTEPIVVNISKDIVKCSRCGNEFKISESVPEEKFYCCEKTCPKCFFPLSKN